MTRRTDTQNWQLEFLDDTIQHFSSNKRGVTEDGACCYIEQCAIGRFLPDELAKELDEGDDGTARSLEEVYRAGGILPEILQRLGVKFLRAVQELHDEDRNWDNGLTKDGKDHAALITENIHKQYYSV